MNTSRSQRYLPFITFYDINESSLIIEELSYLMKKTEILKEVLISEAKAIEAMAARINEEQANQLEIIFEHLRNFGGNLVITGVGKSGIIARKIASTFSSLGLPAYFLHPIEALHGDLGRTTNKDAVIMISKSGTTEEILKLIPFLQVPKERRMALVGALNSPIGNEAGIVWDCSVEKEACINNQAPTTSSTAALAMGDAIAVFYEHIVGLSKEGFAVNHPGGFLGKSLSLKVKDIMIPKNECACVNEDHSLKEAMLEMTKLPVGMCAILDGGTLKGIIVEGDVRRAIAKEDNALDLKISEFMNSNPVSAEFEMLAYDALKLMENRDKAISVMPVIENKQFSGVVRLHDILKEGFVSNRK
jgi:arabinose-5-phosphate isomerase